MERGEQKNRRNFTSDTWSARRWCGGGSPEERVRTTLLCCWDVDLCARQLNGQPHTSSCGLSSIPTPTHPPTPLPSNLPLLLIPPPPSKASRFISRPSTARANNFFFFFTNLWNRVPAWQTFRLLTTGPFFHGSFKRSAGCNDCSRRIVRRSFAYLFLCLFLYQPSSSLLHLTSPFPNLFFFLSWLSCSQPIPFAVIFPFVHLSLFSIGLSL